MRLNKVVSFITLLCILCVFNTGNAYSDDGGRPIVRSIAMITDQMMAGIPVGENEAYYMSAPDITRAAVFPNATGYILIGDSRVVGIDKSCRINETPDNYFVIAAGGQGYDYLKDEAIPAAERIEKAYPHIKRWKYIVNIGINDMSNLYNYMGTLGYLGTVKDVTVVSVNPIVEDPSFLAIGCTNESIADFNNKLRATNNIKYLDTFSVLMLEGYETEDHLHYTDKTNRRIFELIKASVP
jgi:hypothetical protein